MKTEKYLRIARFCARGGTAVGIYYGVLYALTEFAGVWYLLSSVVAGLLSFGANFVMQKFWTFRNRDIKAVPTQLGWYSAMKLTIITSSSIALYCLVEYFHLQYLVASIALTVVYSIMSYFITHKIFTSKEGYHEIKKIL